jgi:hypothetical protein
MQRGALCKLVAFTEYQASLSREYPNWRLDILIQMLYSGCVLLFECVNKNLYACPMHVVLHTQLRLPRSFGDDHFVGLPYSDAEHSKASLT